MPPSTPTELIETQCATANAWQCDYNHHLNFQFYCREFDQAARMLALSCGADPDAPPPATRHVRFHAELLAGDIYRIVSGRLVDGPHAGSIVHWMSHAGTGKLVATALDGGAPVFDCPQVPEATVAAALPRSVDVVEGALAFERMGRDGWLPTARCWVTMDRCSARGELTEQHLTAIFGDAAGHVWERAGAGVVWVRENGLGRITLSGRLRGARLGGAQMSPMHSNFLINAGGATAADLENLGEDVRKKVFQSSGITLEWEIMRVGEYPRE